MLCNYSDTKLKNCTELILYLEAVNNFNSHL
jgi:hypothetical protein